MTALPPEDIIMTAAKGCILYLAFGGLIYLLLYGEPEGLTFSMIVVTILWPAMVLWWALWWILTAAAVIIIVCFMAVGAVVVAEKAGLR